VIRATLAVFLLQVVHFLRKSVDILHESVLDATMR
jgi:hypothetical protein